MASLIDPPSFMDDNPWALPLPSKPPAVPSSPLEEYQTRLRENLLASISSAATSIPVSPQQRRYEALKTHREEARKILEQYRDGKFKDFLSSSVLYAEYRNRAKNPPYKTFWKIVVLALVCFGALISKRMLTNAKISKFSALLPTFTLPALGMGAAWLWYKAYRSDYIYQAAIVKNTLIMLSQDKEKADTKLKAFDSADAFLKLLDSQRPILQNLCLSTTDKDLLDAIYIEEKQEIEVRNAVIPHS